MTQAMRMLETYPQPVGSIDREDLAACIEECIVCSQACVACADACLAEDAVASLKTCIRMDLDCADLCDTTGRILSRRTGENLAVVRAAVEACMEACRACAAECEKHAEQHAHCAACANACRRCEDACSTLLPQLTTG